MNTKTTFLIVLCLCVALLHTAAQTLDRNIFTTNGEVKSTVQSGNTLYLGGAFNQMGYDAKKLARFPKNSTKPDFAFPQLDNRSYIYAIEPDGSGGFYLGGYIYSYNGTPLGTSSYSYVGLIHILSNYTLDPAFTPTDLQNGYVRSIKKKGNRLYIGGYFTVVNGSSRSFVAALNPASGALLGWAPPEVPNSTVSQIEASDSLVYIHGSFSYIGNRYTGSFATLQVTDGSYRRYLKGNYNSISTFKINKNKIYLGGSFTEIGYGAQGIAKVSSTSAVQDLQFPETNNSVYSLLPDGSGGYYAGGSFTEVGGQLRSYIAHILPNGTVDPAFNITVNSYVLCMALEGNTLYLGGYFTSVNGSTRNYAAAVNKNTGALAVWEANANSTVRTIAVSGTKVYLGGDFTSLKGTTRNYAGAVSTANALLSWNPNPDWSVYKITPTSSGGTIFMGGAFYTVNGLTRPYLVKVNSTNGAPAAWAPSPSSYVRDMVLNGNKLYIGGSFYYVNNITRQYLAELDTASNNPTAFQADANNTVLGMSIIANKLYVGGYFTQIKNTNAKYVARIDLATKTVDSWNPGLNSTTYAFAGAGSSIALGGDFHLANSAERNHISAVDINTHQLQAFNPTITSFSGSPNTLLFLGSELFAGGSLGYYKPDYSAYYYNILALDTASGNISRYFNYTPNSTIITMAGGNSKLYVGGYFNGFTEAANSSNTVNRSYLASYTLSNNQLSNEKFEPNNLVYTLYSEPDGDLLAGGDFTLTSFVKRQYLGAINLTTGQATTWNPNPDSYVEAMVLKDTNLFIGGSFYNIYNSTNTAYKPRKFLAAISTKTGLATAWTADANNTVMALALKDTILYAGGYFTNVKGSARNYAAAVGTGGTGALKAWNPNANNRVVALHAGSNSVYLGGSFTSIGATGRNYLAQVNTTNGSPTSWNPSPNHYVYSLTANNTTLYAGGMFTTIAGQTRKAVAAFNLNSNALTPFNPQLANQWGYQVALYALANYGKHLFMGSDYSSSMDSIKGTARKGLGAADTTTNNATPFNPRPNYNINMLQAGTNKLFVGGDYTSLGISPASAYFNVFSLQPLTQASTLVFSNLQPTSVTAGWTNGSGEGRIVLVKQGSAAGTPADGVGYTAKAAYGQGSNIGGSYVVYKSNGSSVAVTNLQPSTTYYFAVYEYSGSGNGTEYLQNPALTGSITTPCLCGSPTGLTTSSITSTSATLSWTSQSCASSYTVEYKKASAATWTAKAATTNSTNLTGLAPGTTYNWRVQSVCGTATSAFTNGSNFTTSTSLTTTVEGRQEGWQASIYPNPAVGKAVLRIAGAAKPLTVILADATGRIIWTKTNTREPRINLQADQLGAGVYMITVTDGTETKVLKLVQQQP